MRGTNAGIVTKHQKKGKEKGYRKKKNREAVVKKGALAIRMKAVPPKECKVVREESPHGGKITHLIQKRKEGLSKVTTTAMQQKSFQMKLGKTCTTLAKRTA